MFQFIKIIFLSLFSKYIFRKIYWIFKLNKAIIFPVKGIALPIVCEGKGKLQISKKAEIDKAEISVGKGSNVKFGENSKFRVGSVIKVGFDIDVEFGDDFLIENFSRIYLSKKSRVGYKVEIATYCSIFSREEPISGSLKIGDNVQIGDFNIIDLTGNVEIGSDVALGPNCVIYTHDHDYRKNTSKIAWKGELIVGSVKIEDGAWIGSGVTILPGVTIGKSAIIAAGSIITKSVPENTLWAGVPARQIKTIESQFNSNYNLQ